MENTILQDEWVVLTADQGEIFRGEDALTAAAVAAEYRIKNPSKFPPVIRHDYWSRVE